MGCAGRPGGRELRRHARRWCSRRARAPRDSGQRRHPDRPRDAARSTVRRAANRAERADLHSGRRSPTRSFHRASSPTFRRRYEKPKRGQSSRYAPALARRDSLGDADRSELLAELAGFTGLDASAIDRKTLTIPMPQFSEQLLRDRNLIVGRYESRMTAPFDPEQQKMYDPTKDPSLKDLIDDVAVTRYFRSVLKYESDLPYQGPFGGGYPPPTASAATGCR